MKLSVMRVGQRFKIWRRKPSYLLSRSSRESSPSAARPEKSNGERIDCQARAPHIVFSAHAYSHIRADSAVTDETGGLVEHRFPTHLKLLLRAIGIDAAEDEIQEGLPGCNPCLQYFPLRLIPASHLVIAYFTHKGVDPDS